MIKKYLFAVLLLTAFTFTTGCATNPGEHENTPDYVAAIDQYSDGDVQYDGAVNNFKYRATLINSPIQELLINKEAEMYLWDPVRKQGELTKLQADNQTNTHVFLSFFTPDRNNDNMSSKNSIWSVYLQTSRGRFQGTVTKVRENRTELIAFYPYHTRFTTAYRVQFPIGVSQIESEQTEMTITGPLGMKSIKFPARK